MPWWQGVAEVYHQRHIAEQVPSTHAGRDDVFRTIGHSFCASAAAAFTFDDGQDLYFQAAGCFVEAREHVLAAQGFVQCQRYSEAVLQYRSAEMLGEAMEIIDSHRAEVDRDVTDMMIQLFGKEGGLGTMYAATDDKTTPSLSSRPEFSSEEELAARRIQQWFRRYRERKKRGRGGPIYDAFCRRVVDLNSKGLGHAQNGLYRIYLRGMMPRVMRLLSNLLDTARLAKRQVDLSMQTSLKEVVDDRVLARRSLIL